MPNNEDPFLTWTSHTYAFANHWQAVLNSVSNQLYNPEPMTVRIEHLSGVNLYTGPKEQLPGLSLGGANFSHAQIANWNFTGCNLEGSSFKEALLVRCKFNNANLTGCDFTDADVYEADFTGAKYNGPTIPGWRRTVDGVLEKKPAEECTICDYVVPEGRRRECGKCLGCCTHASCIDCGCCSDHLCRHCEGCHDCCACDYCVTCNQLSECTGCSRCGDDCICYSDDDDDDDEESITGKPFEFKPGSKFKCRRAVGVEWEYNYAIQLDAWCKKWRGAVHHDGSCGFEAVTAPIAGDHIRDCLQDLSDTFKERRAECDDRCGVHVHVDARDLQWGDMYRLLWVYSKCEPLMYLLAGQHRARVDRDRTSYCKPVGHEFLESLSEVDRKGAVLSVALGRNGGRKIMRSSPLSKKDGGRYRGLNIIPWLAGRAYKDRKDIVDRKTGKKSTILIPKSDSTVEFRQHTNTMNAERVIGWSQLCAKLVDWCANATDREAQDLPKSALRALCTVIAPECAPWILHRVNEWRKATKVDSKTKKRKVPRRIAVKDGVFKLRVAA